MLPLGTTLVPTDNTSLLLEVVDGQGSATSFENGLVDRARRNAIARLQIGDGERVGRQTEPAIDQGGAGEDPSLTREAILNLNLAATDRTQQ